MATVLVNIQRHPNHVAPTAQNRSDTLNLKEPSEYADILTGGMFRRHELVPRDFGGVLVIAPYVRPLA